MVYCCLNSAYKIYSITSDINTEIISNFVKNNFNIDLRISVVMLLQYSYLFNH